MEKTTFRVVQDQKIEDSIRDLSKEKVGLFESLPFFRSFICFSIFGSQKTHEVRSFFYSVEDTKYLIKEIREVCSFLETELKKLENKLGEGIEKD